METHAISSFWTWFAGKDANLRSIRDADDPFWSTALSQLRQIHPALRFELSGPIHSIDETDGTRDWILTVEGNTSLFALVDEVIAAAPELPGWNLVALKPAMGFDFVTTYEGIRFDPKLIWFMPLKFENSPSDLGLRIAVPGFTEDARRITQSALMIMIETGLGERAAALDIQHFQIGTLPSEPETAGYIELPELAPYIAWRKRQLQNPS